MDPQQSTGLDILIVEDSPTQARRLEHFLLQQGYRVRHAPDGRAALARVLDEKPQLVISDVVMPEMDGYELCRHLKAHPGLADIPVILVTTLSDPGDVIRGLECGADNFIIKPYDEHYLVTRVEYVLLNQQVRQAARPEPAVEIFFNGRRHVITADRVQILSLLLSTYDAAIQRNKELTRAEQALAVANREADRANRAKSEFISRMSHDLRTPLNAVLGFAQLLESDTLREDQAESVRQILKGGQQLLELVNEVLDISRIEAGHLSLSSESVAVEEVAHEVADLVRPLCAPQRIRMSTGALGSCALHVQADRLRLRQVLVNLVGNAVKYNREEGSVTIQCGRVPEGRVRIEVSDTGAGIPVANFELLFRPFERLGAERGAVEGTGLGLALSKGLIAAMGGQIGVRSVIDQGSTFWIELPEAAPPASRRDDRADPRRVARIESVRGTVLYIEDNRSNVRLIERVLERRPGVRLVCAESGEAGLDRAVRDTPDLILLDLHLPDMGGEEVLRRLCAEPQTRGVPVVVLSADATSEQAQRLLGAGAVAYLTKPLDVPELLSAVDARLGGLRAPDDASFDIGRTHG